jgi:lipopolysaccharide transport system ATP-binding protein
MDSTVIEVKGLSKIYHRQRSLWHWLFRAASARSVAGFDPVEREALEKGQAVLALDDVNFEVKRGEAFGIIGRNGAGKSTLLQVLAGTLQPSKGSFLLRGRVTALLELGSGFNPEFTGSENIYLAGAILGIDRAEMSKRFDEIVAFADIGPFIDQPVKTYSTGMVMRVAFAVAVSVQPDVFIIDEALSVGDILFQQKCSQRLRDLIQGGATLLVVTHDTAFVLNMCQRALWLDKGKTAFLGDATACVRAYLAAMAKAAGNDLSLMRHAQNESSVVLPKVAPLDVSTCERLGDGLLKIDSVWMLNEVGSQSSVFQLGEWCRLVVVIKAEETVHWASAGCELRNRHGTVVFATGLRVIRKLFEVIPAGERRVVVMRFRCELAPGQYTLDVGCGSGEGEANSFQRLIAVSVLEICSSPSAEVVHGVVRLPCEVSTHQILGT